MLTPEATWAAVLIETVEAHDPTGELLPHEARRSAPAALDASPTVRLAAHSAALSQVLAERRPRLHRAARRYRRLGGKTLVVACAIAALLGSQAQWLSSMGERRFHVLAPWLLFLLGMNVLLELWGLLAVVRPRRVEIPLFARWTLLLSSKLEMRGEDALARRVLDRFRERWFDVATPLLSAEARRGMHAASICMALGALAAAAVAGSLRRYEATVESTFFSPEQVHAFVTGVLHFPASLAGVELPPLAQNATFAIGLARPWLYAYAAAFGVFVLLPRLVLFVLESARLLHESWQLGRRLAPARPKTVIDLALASHTNIGKTSLARTLLANTVGQVRDAQNVTTSREGYVLLGSSEVELRVWDTPGFGDVEPARRYLRAGAWGRLWQRWHLTDEGTILARETMDALADEADVVAYLVDAGDPPEASAYVEAELALLEEAGVPFFVVLNQLSAWTDTGHREVEDKWTRHLAQSGHHPEVISLDAHERCWIQEARLMHQVAELCRARRPAADRIMPTWQRLQAERLAAATGAMAHMLCAAAEAREKTKSVQERDAAQQRLVLDTQRAFAQATESLFDIYGVTGTAGQLIVNLMGTQTERVVEKPDPAIRAFHGVLAGALSGMASGIAADVVAGGLTFGSGALVGAVIGALGGTGASDGLHWFKNRGVEEIRWTNEELMEMLQQSCELYLAVAHYGRARGTFRTEEARARSEPWRPLIERQMATHWPKIQRELKDEDRVALRLRDIVTDLLRELWPRSAQLVDFERLRKGTA